MTPFLVALLLAEPSPGRCVEALRPEPGTLVERADAMVRACGSLISSPSCREAFGRFHAVGQRPMPLRRLVDACWPAYCRWDVETPCDAKPARDAVELGRRWSALHRAIWRHEALVDADVISRRFEEGTWSGKASDEPIGSMELHTQGEGVLLVARFGSRTRQWTTPATPTGEDYASVQAWLEREVPTSGWVSLAGEPSVLFLQVKMVMDAVHASGQPSFRFRVLR